MICIIRCHSAAEVLLLQVQAPKLELLGPKSQSRTVQSCKSEVPGQSSLAGRFGLAGGVMGMARELHRPRHTLSQAGGTSLSN